MISRMKVTAALTVLLVTIVMLNQGLPVVKAAVATVTVDMSVENGTPQYWGSGFLYGLTDDGQNPDSSLFEAIKPQWLRAGTMVIGPQYASYASRWSQAQAYYNRSVTAGAKYQLVLYDFLYDIGYNASANEWPGDGGQWTLWEDSVDQVITSVINNNWNSSVLYWDIWNEPDLSNSWGASQSQYREMWKRTYNLIKNRIPDAKFVGPDISRYDHDWLDSWLQYVSANNVKPDIITWHFSEDTYADASDLYQLKNSRGFNTATMMEQEYAWNYPGYPLQENPGYILWKIARLEKAQIPGLHAIWKEDNIQNTGYDTTANDGTIGHILIKSGNNYLKKGQWWAYKSYADITGTIVDVSSDSMNFDGVAGKDASLNQAQIVLGNRLNDTGLIDININRLDQASYLINNGQVRVVVKKIPYNNNGEVNTPITVLNEVLNVNNNSVTLTIDWLTAQDGYVVTLERP
ncbi:hypothetical protein SY83_13475 [Paenibacillus swuensis]|uniref:Uncharacterized protein n=1 Tax=Paenibacillus swuensis TaxID=1178515 RepID=A0A172TJL6_9BACL|nr:hypothetical protein [Paenibacillus swuensis]ANE47104.1 hypothetical protein SY83_13475 [Paenibacillus swuensis]